MYKWHTFQNLKHSLVHLILIKLIKNCFHFKGSDIELTNFQVKFF